MKVLYVYGDDDYHALTFESSGLTVDNVVKEVESGEDEFETPDGYFYDRIEEFGEVDEGFIEFLIDEGFFDYDSMKHRNYYIIKKKE